MRLTKAEGSILLGAIDAEIESQGYRRRTRGNYSPQLDADTEEFLREQDRQRADDLRSVRDKIKTQL